jgi:hypothetical protein
MKLKLLGAAITELIKEHPELADKELKSVELREQKAWVNIWMDAQKTWYTRVVWHLG